MKKYKIFLIGVLSLLIFGKRLVFGYLDIRRFLTHNDRR